jgi:hypothetical protein
MVNLGGENNFLRPLHVGDYLIDKSGANFPNSSASRMISSEKPVY